MNAAQISHIEASHRLVAPIAEPAAAIFYRRLFELDPSLRPMFPADLSSQGRKLMQAIGFVVAHLRVPDRLLPAVSALGARHAGYGVQRQHYDTVGQALLLTLAEGLGDAFTPAVQDAWESAYALLAMVMQVAGQGSEAAAQQAA
ncbi:globin family protein [Falsiroseomonas sp. E2-1-a20]|uniref:globin family protein n=1 Tax=Falsiroseomonas sp. E2-1-a20 TaxID=3239300 RepID=UPI003F3389BE